MPNYRKQIVINPNGQEEETAFIIALKDDNIEGLKRDPGYVDRMMRRDPKTARAMLEGDWNVFAGQEFTDFDIRIHVVKTYYPPVAWVRGFGLDHGFNDPTAVLFYADNPDTFQRVYYREIYKSEMTVPMIGNRMAQLMPPEEEFKPGRGDPTMWARNPINPQAQTIADVYQAYGIYMLPSTNKHDQWLSKVHAALQARLPDGKTPAVVFCERCENLVRTLPAITSDPNDPDDILPGQEDHMLAALFYSLDDWRPPFIQERGSKPEHRQRSPYDKAVNL